MGGGGGGVKDNQRIYLCGGMNREDRAIEDTDNACSLQYDVNKCPCRVVSYPDPYSHSCGWITSPPRSGDVIHPQLWE